MRKRARTRRMSLGRKGRVRMERTASSRARGPRSQSESSCRRESSSA